MRIFCAIILLVLLGLLRQTGVAQAAPVPTYDILDCSVSQCNFGPVSSAPTGSPQPTQGDFQSFLGQQLGQDLSADTFFWQAAGSNSQGYQVGSVSDGGALGIATAYVWNGSALVCCSVDSPYNLTGINDNSLIVGNHQDGSALLGGSGAGAVYALCPRHGDRGRCRDAPPPQEGVSVFVRTGRKV